MLLLLYPQPWPGNAWPAAAGALLLGTAYAVAFEVFVTSYSGGLPGPRALQGILRGALWGGIFLLAFRRLPAGPGALEQGRPAALLATALVLEPTFRAGAYASAGSGWDPRLGALSVLYCALLATSWLWKSVRGPSELRKPPRRVAWLALGLPLVAILVHPYYDVFDGGPMGLLRTLAVALVAYAILRHQLLGIDLKVRWTISRGTVAALILGVFFIITSLAQNYLSEEWGWIYGGMATGVLLFAIHPLQRLGERIASAAMPGVRSFAKMTEDERLALYRDQLVAAWRDGNLSAAERRVLEVTRERLGISPEDALRLEREVAP